VGTDIGCRETKQMESEKFCLNKDGETTINVFAENGIGLNELLRVASSSGLVDSGLFDKVVYGKIDEVRHILEYSLSDICQFQIVLTYTSTSSWQVLKRPCEFPMLQEDGFYLLQENGDQLLVQGLVP